MNLRDLIRSFGQPSSFRGDPYGGLLNQWGHYALGAASFVLVCLAYSLWAKEMPYRYPTAAVMIGVYLAFEIGVQKWRGKDTLEDTLFYAMGVLTIATTIQEVQAEGMYSMLVVDRAGLAVAIITASAAALVYGATRAR